MSSSETTTQQFTSPEARYDREFNLLVVTLKRTISGYDFTLDEIKEAFAEATKEFEENNN